MYKENERKLKQHFMNWEKNDWKE